MGTATFEYYQANRERFLEGLTSLLKIPSISTLPEHKSDVRRAAEFVSSELRTMGMRGVEIIDGKEGQNTRISTPAARSTTRGRPTSSLKRSRAS